MRLKIFKKFIFLILFCSFFSCSNKKTIESYPVSGWYDFPLKLSSESFEIYKRFSTKDTNGYYSLHKNYVNYHSSLTLDVADLKINTLSKDSIIMNSKILEGTDVKTWILPTNEHIKTGIPIFLKTKKIWDSRIFFDKSKKLNNSLKTLSLIINPGDFFNYEKGIYVQGIYGDMKNPKKGNYSQKGDSWRKKSTLHIFESNGDLKLKSYCGIQIQGDFSRAQPQKSLQLIFDKPFCSDPITTQLLGKKRKIYRLVLRTPFTSAPQGESILADSYLGEIANNLGLDAMIQEPINLYLNGEYWGLYHISEKIDEHYLKEKYKISKNSIDIVKYNNAFEDSYEAIHGKKDEWINLINYISKNDLSNDKIYKKVCDKIDVKNLIDYLIIETFFANKDWPSNNFKFWKSIEKDNKWRFIIYDLDATFRKDNMFKYLISTHQTGNNIPTSTILFRKLFKNKKFKSRFKSRYFKLLNTHLNSERLLKVLNEKEIQLEYIIVSQTQRWGMPKSFNFWKTRIAKMKKYIKEREQSYNDHLNYLLTY